MKVTTDDPLKIAPAHAGPIELRTHPGRRAALDGGVA